MQWLPLFPALAVSLPSQSQGVDRYKILNTGRPLNKSSLSQHITGSPITHPLIHTLCVLVFSRQLLCAGHYAKLRGYSKE